MPYGMPESVTVYNGSTPVGVAQPYSVAPGSDWGAAQQAPPVAQGSWNIGPAGPSWQGVPSDNMGAASGAVFRTRNIANPMTLYREMGYNPNYNMPGSMAAYQNYGIPPVVTQRSPYASLAAVYGPGNSVAPLTGFPSQYPHVLNGVPQDYLAPTLSLYEMPMYQQSGLANMLMMAMMGMMGKRGGGAGAGTGSGTGSSKRADTVPDMALPPTGIDDLAPVRRSRVAMDQNGMLIPGSGITYESLPAYAPNIAGQLQPESLPIPAPLGQPQAIGGVQQTPPVTANATPVPAAPTTATGWRYDPVESAMEQYRQTGNEFYRNLAEREAQKRNIPAQRTTSTATIAR